MGETVAVRLFSRLRARCVQTDARAALDRILRDEVRHRDFGWTLLEWLLSTEQGDQLRQRSIAELPRCFSRLKKNYGYAQLNQPTDGPSAVSAWGLMPAACYAEALQESYERDYIPLFDSLNIDARRAWEQAA